MTKSKKTSRIRRAKSTRMKIRELGATRLCVNRTPKHIYAQIIDDGPARTILESSSLSEDIRPTLGGRGGNKDGAAIIGQSIAKKALEKGIKRVVFDRNGFLYHGRIKALAEAARETGLEF